MSYRYDAGTTTFSSEGRIMQVEYAIQSINQAGTAIGVLYQNGVILAAEKKNTGRLIDYLYPEKMAKLDNHIITALAGSTADAGNLIDYMRNAAQKHLLRYDEPIPVAQLVRLVCDTKHSYTQFGGLRPFGVSFLIAGWDEQKGPQLYLTDPSGNFGGWKATAIGENNQTAQSVLKSLYHDGMTAEEAMDVTVRVLCKTLDSTSLSSDKLEFAILEYVEGEGPRVRILSQEEIEGPMQKYEAAMKASAEEKD